MNFIIKCEKYFKQLYLTNRWNPNTFCGCPRGVIVKAQYCRIVVSEFELQLHYYIHFRTNALGKGLNPLILPAMG